MKRIEEVHNNRQKTPPENEKLDMRSLCKGVIFLLVSQLFVLLLPSKSHAESSVYIQHALENSFYQIPACNEVRK